jgi:hypothetical protein
MVIRLQSPGMLQLRRGAGISAAADYPDWYYSLERYISYGADQAERVVEGIIRIEHTLEEYVRVHTELSSYIDSQTDIINNLFGNLVLYARLGEPLA